MKVLHVSQMAQGGIASYFQEILPAQVEAFGRGNVQVVLPQHEVRFVAIDDPDLFRTISTASRTGSGLTTFLRETVRIIRTFDPDIVHLHSSFAGALIRLWFLLAPLNRPKIVYCAHGWAFNMQVSQRRRRMYAAVERALATVSDAIVCISQYEYDQAIRRGLPRRRLHRISNGISDKTIVPERGDQIYDPATLNLLFVGRQDRQKGFDILIEAMRALLSKPITLHVVGSAVVSRESVVVDPANVVRHGWRSREDVEQFIAGADALVMPSRWEGFGLVAVEAMRQELPVCASAVDALPELVRDGVSGYLFPPDDAAALARLLGALDRGALRRMGPDARQWFLDHFTADRMNRDLIALYRRLLGTT